MRTLELGDTWTGELSNVILGHEDTIETLFVDARIFESNFRLILQKLSNLRVLVIEGFLKKLPSDIGSLTNLEELHIPYLLEDEALPITLFDLKNLRSLHIGHNRLLDLPDNFENLAQLETLFLDLRSSKITSLPNSIVELESLQSLTVWGQIECFPSGFERLKSLQCLEVYFKEGTDRSCVDDIGNLLLLEKLHTGPIVPAGIENLLNLRDLELHGVNHIPSTLGKLYNLQKLSFEGGCFTLPDEIGDLKNLRELMLRQTNITSLPNTIGELIELRYVRIDNESDFRVPESIIDLRNLNCILLAGEIDLSQSQLEFIAKING